MGGMGDDFAFTNMNSLQYLPHEGNLCRVVEEDSSAPSSYVIEIVTATTCPLSRNPKDLLLLDASTPETPTSIAIAQTHELHFTRQDFEFASRLFSILDTESSNVVHRSVVQDFVHKRCPVFSKRDDDLFRLGLPLMRRRPKNSTSSLEDPVTAVSGQTNSSHFSPTFDEVWTSVVACSRQSLCLSSSSSSSIEEASYIGVEGWLVFFRFIAFAQYLEAKRRFSARHLQQTMRHRNAPRGSEMVVVDVPPPEPPTPISPELLALHEQQSKKSLPPPELDLDHSLLAAHDAHNQRRRLRSIHENHGEQQGMPSHCVAGRVKVVLFGSPKSPIVLQQPSPSSSSLEFAVSYQRKSLGLSGTMPDEIVVRRSMSDMMWLDETFTSHKVLGGTLCGRILPPFHALSTSGGVILSPHHFGSSSDESRFMNSKTSTNTTGALHAAAAAGVGRIRDAAKSFMGPIGSYWASSSTETNTDDSTISTPTVTHSTSTHKKVSKIKRSLNFCLPELYYKPNSSEGRARQLERYLNYLLEHPALSTSFPLNAILTVRYDIGFYTISLLASKSRFEISLRIVFRPVSPD